jgi:RNA polymerase sigma-70 factor (ECF subfamily)
MTHQTFISQVLPLKDKLFRYAKSILSNADEAKDVVQETLLKVWEKRDEMSNYQNLEAWCMTLARNFSLQRFRDKNHHHTGLDGLGEQKDQSSTSFQNLEWKDTLARIDEIVNGMPLKQKEVFQLRDIEGYAYQEISEITGYALNDVKVSLFRARQVIKEKLNKIYAYENSKDAYR